MKIVTWNVNGIRARQDEVAAFVAREQPDVLCLQEIKAAADHIPKTVNVPGYWCYWHGTKGYSGVALLVRKEVAFDRPTYVHPDFDYDTRIAAARVDGILVASIYVPNGGRDFASKVRFLRAMAAYVEALRATGDRVVLCGDLNVTRAPRDVHPEQRDDRVVCQRPEERALLEHVLTAGKLHDLGRELDPDNDALFTWWGTWRNMRQRNVGWRLDYVLASGDLAATAVSCVSMREYGTSDHAPVMATFGAGASSNATSNVTCNVTCNVTWGGRRRGIMIVVADFDGTLTIEDVTTLVWDTYLTYDWRSTLLPPTYEGTWSPLEMIARGYAGVRVPPARLLAEIRRRVRLRPGVEALATYCRGRGWPFAVASHGLSFYLEALLPSWIPFTAFVGTFQDDRWEVSLPKGFVLARGQDFKTQVVAALEEKHPGHPTVFIGDGRLDLPAAQTCGRAFAVKGSRLARLMRESGRDVFEFTRLDEVAAEL